MNSAAPAPTAENHAIAIEAIGLTKSFGETRAVAGVDIAVPRGSVPALPGPNGAGKTTIVRVPDADRRARRGRRRRD